LQEEESGQSWKYNKAGEPCLSFVLCVTQTIGTRSLANLQALLEV
jgi:hypothetical protein